MAHSLFRFTLLLTLCVWPLFCATSSSAGTISLTQAEQDWITANRTMRAVYDSDYPPFEYTDSTGNFAGFSAGLAHLIEQKTGLIIQPQTAPAWATLEARLRKGEADMTLALAPTEPRKAYLSFTRIYVNFPVVIITRRDALPAPNPEALRGKRVGVVHGYYHEQRVRERFGHMFEVVPVANVPDGLRAVAFGDIDAFIENAGPAAWFMARQGIGSLRVAGEMGIELGLAIGVRNDNPLRLSIVQKGLEAITDAEWQELYSTWLGVGYDMGKQRSRYMLPLGLALAVTAALLLGYFALSRRLRRVISEQTAIIRQSEERMQLAIRACKGAVWEWDIKGNRGSVSPEWYTSLGYEAYAFPPTIEIWNDMLHPDDREAAANFRRESLQQAGRYSMSYRLRDADNNYRWILSSLESIADARTGKPIRVVGINIDITEQRRTAARYRVLFETSRDGAFLIGDDRIIEANPQMERIFGYTVKELCQLHPGDLAPVMQPNGRPSREVAEEVITRAATEGSVTFEFLHVHKSGREFPAEVVLTNVDLYGERFVLASLRDITERKTMARMAVQAEKMISVGSLAAGLAHEINNPLGAILHGIQNIERRLSVELAANKPIALRHSTTMQAILGYTTDRGILRMLSGMRDAGERAAGIVRNMLQFSRQSDGARSTHEIGTIINETLNLASSDYNLSQNYDFRSISVVRELNVDSVYLACSKVELEQVLLNLIQNAAQAMSKAGTPSPTLRIATSVSAGWLYIDVADNGPGIEEHCINQVFDPFFTTKAVGEGTGLGLSISYFIITQNHGGTLTVDSTPGKGTHFRIGLPLESHQRPDSAQQP